MEPILLIFGAITIVFAILFISSRTASKTLKEQNEKLKSQIEILQNHCNALRNNGNYNKDITVDSTGKKIKPVHTTSSVIDATTDIFMITNK